MFSAVAEQNNAKEILAVNVRKNVVMQMNQAARTKYADVLDSTTIQFDSLLEEIKNDIVEIVRSKFKVKK